MNVSIASPSSDGILYGSDYVKQTLSSPLLRVRKNSSTRRRHHRLVPHPFIGLHAFKMIGAAGNHAVIGEVVCYPNFFSYHFNQLKLIDVVASDSAIEIIGLVSEGHLMRRMEPPGALGFKLLI
ncbi:hypothetical protein OUZ56_000559 [Daphnia magna]|uniref:Uncharacterized protein n=1 Tax=Daphnia magna TaxID=35525 RepID=A0ABR0A015_9CRUS|nr:hypothetical protein OUZ56_000559 [Daphnia magna]